MGRRRHVPTPASRSQSSDWVADYHAGLTQSELEHDAIEQDSYDRRDGSRGLYAFRDNGGFGSYPVHDDYGDESFAD